MENVEKLTVPECSKKFLLIKYQSITTEHKYAASCMHLNKIFNPFKPSGVKWLHYKVFKAILV